MNVSSGYNVYTWNCLTLNSVHRSSFLCLTCLEKFELFPPVALHTKLDLLVRPHFAAVFHVLLLLLLYVASFFLFPLGLISDRNTCMIVVLPHPPNSPWGITSPILVTSNSHSLVEKQLLSHFHHFGNLVSTFVVFWVKCTPELQWLLFDLSLSLHKKKVIHLSFVIYFQCGH